MSTPPTQRITVDEYEQIGAAGILEDPSRIELIDGYLVAKKKKTPEHCYSTNQVLKALRSQLPDGWTWWQYDPVRIPPYDEPEPDVSIVRGSDADYKHRHPTGDEVSLVVEVSDLSLGWDRGPKLSAYARGKIPVYWIVNLVDRQIEVYSRPSKNGYKSRKDFLPGQQVPVTIGGQSLPPIAVDDILP
jgi:Uma2 family endonuclease